MGMKAPALSAEELAAAIADALRMSDPDALVDGDPGSPDRRFYIDGKFCLLDVARRVVTGLCQSGQPSGGPTPQ